jgi:predicted protein tyrosine phosphatase
MDTVRRIESLQSSDKILIPKKGKVNSFAEKQKEKTRQRRKQPVESSSENELCGAFDDILDDESYTNLSELVHRYHVEKQYDFLQMDFPSQHGKCILVAIHITVSKKVSTVKSQEGS